MKRVKLLLQDKGTFPHKPSPCLLFLRGILGDEHEPDIGIQTGQTVRNGLGGTAFGPEYDQGVRGKIRETAVRNGLKGSGHEDGRETGKGEAVLRQRRHTVRDDERIEAGGHAVGPFVDITRGKNDRVRVEGGVIEGIRSNVGQTGGKRERFRQIITEAQESIGPDNRERFGKLKGCHKPGFTEGIGADLRDPFGDNDAARVILRAPENGLSVL